MHSHFLPGIDDGCATEKESFAVLYESGIQNVGCICATPHYYSDRTVGEFLETRDSAYARLMETMEKIQDFRRDRGMPPAKYPDIRLGAEVAFSPTLIYEERLRELCYEGTDYLLVEMPFSAWTRKTVGDLETISRAFGVTPVLAHPERYLKWNDATVMEAVLDIPVLLQVNAQFIIRQSRELKRLIGAGRLDLIGSDCHNSTTRPQNMERAAEKMKKMNLYSDFLKAQRRGREILGID